MTPFGGNIKAFALVVLFSVIALAQSPAHATARAEYQVTGLTITHTLVNGTSTSTQSPFTGLTFFPPTASIEGFDPMNGWGRWATPRGWLNRGPDLLTGESATFSFDVILSGFDQGLSGAIHSVYMDINPPIFTAPPGILDVLQILDGYEFALSSIGVGIYQDCRQGFDPTFCNGLTLTQYGFHEVRTNQDDLADAVYFSGTVSGTVRNPANDTRPAVAFLISSLYEQSSTTTVPEPETYAMLLAGLGLLGFMARRRKHKVL